MKARLKQKRVFQHQSHTGIPPETSPDQNYYDYNYLYDNDSTLLTGTPVTDTNFKNFDHGNISGTYNDEQVNFSGSYLAERSSSLRIVFTNFNVASKLMSPPALWYSSKAWRSSSPY